jgi:hypothetical protein
MYTPVTQQAIVRNRINPAAIPGAAMNIPDFDQDCLTGGC